MSTSFPMLSPMVLVARQVYVPASCLMISFCHSILRSLKEICCVLFQCLDTVESSNNRPRPTSSCLKNLGGEKDQFDSSLDFASLPTMKLLAQGCCQLCSQGSGRPCLPPRLSRWRLLSRLAQLDSNRSELRCRGRAQKSRCSFGQNWL